MHIVELAFVAVALSMDALAASVACGISAPKISLKNSLIVAAAFGFFQAAMPLAGWNAGKFAYEHITALDHWVAFLLLALVGGKMVFDSIRKNASESECVCKSFAYPKIDLKVLLMLSVATSLDALAVGVSFSCAKYPILAPSAIIGATTFVLSFLGIKFGGRIGRSHNRKFEALGGIILVAIGIKILISG